ncbi:N-acyl-phosphatidylethanolamine-hydrolyzing phospholipase D-like [Elysia marginata]|uniref:N-acyl-phosphatidylethanolamine-hydrolyzing phospholipase D-like n=1 Tax=Elysia marginata TaxID=1093978 RepID=A0AAV4HG25_9GAST|nr:N-acyl-phosphatidylethanolamine-hydrolyzing phospholipase D-like [Elysia marginata]
MQMEMMEEDEHLELELNLPDIEVDEDEEELEAPMHTSQASSSSSEFHPENGITMPIYENGRFQNPWKTWQHPRLPNLFKLLFCTTKEKNRMPGKTELDATLPVLEPDLTIFEKPPPSGIRHLWIGHSTSLVQFDGITILTDPVFSDRCSPLRFIGNKRFRPTPCSIEALPKIDFVLISNANYDHLDYASVIALKER